MHVLITGGTDGLGLALARKIAGKHDVTIHGRNEEKTRKIADELGCSYVVADLLDLDESVRVFSGLCEEKSVDVLVNNAGHWVQGPVETNKPAEIRKSVLVNASAVMEVTSIVVRGMKRRQSGRIVNVISQGGLYPRAERSVYNASKWAITGFTQSLFHELAPYGIGVTGFYPGGIKTGFFRKAGIEKDTSLFLDVKDAVRVLEFVIDSPSYVNIPEIGVQKL